MAGCYLAELSNLEVLQLRIICMLDGPGMTKLPHLADKKYTKVQKLSYIHKTTGDLQSRFVHSVFTATVSCDGLIS